MYMYVFVYMYKYTYISIYDIRLISMDWQIYKLSELNNKITIVTFWSVEHVAMNSVLTRVVKLPRHQPLVARVLI